MGFQVIINKKLFFYYQPWINFNPSMGKELHAP